MPRAAGSRAGPTPTRVAGPRARGPAGSRTPPPRTTRRGGPAAPRSGWSGRIRSCRSRTGAPPARRSCTATDTSRPGAPRARGAPSPDGESLVLLGQTVDECLEVVRGGASLVRAPVHVEARRAFHAAGFTLLYARLNAPGVALAVHAGVVLVEVDADGPREIAERAARVLPRLGPLVIGEQLVVHLPELALLPRALGRQRGVAGVRVRGEGKIAIAPPHPARGDQLLADHGHLHRRERRAERTLEVRVLRDLDRRRVRPQRVAAEPVRRRDRDGPARCRRRRALRAVPQDPPTDHRHAHQQQVEPLHSPGTLHGSSSSSSSNPARAP